MNARPKPYGEAVPKLHACLALAAKRRRNEFNKALAA